MNSEMFNAIIPAFRYNALLLGLLSNRFREEEYQSDSIEGVEFRVSKKALPNGFARIDKLEIGNEIAGTIVCCQICDDVYHMVGMFVCPQFRSKSSSDAKSDVASKANTNRPISAATYLLAAFLKDIIKDNTQVSLEVLDHNKPAWHLYEKKLYLDDQLGQNIGFRLMNKNEIMCYAKMRNKKIGKWHKVRSSSGTEGEGVQWSHVPDFDGTPRWSINRLYIIKPENNDFAINPNEYNWIKSKFRMIYSVVRYGQTIAFIKKLVSGMLSNS